MDTFVIEINNYYNLKMYKSNDQSSEIIIDLDEEIFSNNSIKDEVQFDYIFNKLLKKVGHNSNLVLRFNLINNIFRFQDNPSLKEDEIEAFVKYNIEKIIPFNLEHFKIESNSTSDQIFIYGLSKETINYFAKFFENGKYKNLYFTLFISEVVPLLYKFTEKSVIVNICKGYLEVIGILEKKINYYKVKGFERDEDIPKILKNEIFNINSLSSGDISYIYLYGNTLYTNLLGESLRSSYTGQILSIDLNESEYFGARNETD